MPNQLKSVDHIVVLMLENRSFDHMLGFLYSDTNNLSPAGQSFEGLTGYETVPGPNGIPIPVSRITATPNAYFMPGANPGEGYAATNEQLFCTATPPATPPTQQNQGFAKNFAYTLDWETKERPREVVPGTNVADIMRCFEPSMLPVLSGLARGYAVCDHWYGSAPTETMPNRAFALAGTSQGHLDDTTKSYTTSSIFGLLTNAQVSWRIYGYDNEPLTRGNFPDTLSAPNANFGLFTDFQSAAADGTLAAFSFLEPSWGGPSQNDQHPVSDVAAGERFIHEVYRAVRDGPRWNKTLLIITYDEHGGCYDHVAPPWSATPPDGSNSEFGFDFRRFGPRVPTVLVSPLIPPGTVYRAPIGAAPLDHTSLLKSVEVRWNLAPLTARDAAAVDLGPALSLTEPRTDDPLADVMAPASTGVKPGVELATHLQRLQAEMLARLPIPDDAGGVHYFVPDLTSSEACNAYIRQRALQWRRVIDGRDSLSNL